MYIRTKDGIYEMSDNYIIKNNKLYEKEYFVNPFGDSVEEFLGKVLIGEILAKSDNLADLCDAVFYYDCDLECMQNTWLKGKNVANFKRYFDYVKTGHIKDVKGAILIDKGLIYVAKMDSEGKLVLI